MRPLIEGSGLYASYGPHRILESASFRIMPGEKVGLVGPNGSGKTTVLRLIAGRVKPDLGDLFVPPDLRFGYLTQNFEFPPDATVGSLLARVPPHVERIQAEAAEIEKAMEGPAFYETPDWEARLARYNELQERVGKETALAGAAGDSPMLAELGFREKDLPRKVKSLSGGEKTRLLLARTLAAQEDLDLFMLDEPTNHLDIESVEWLEDFLAVFPGAVLLVAHDQYLLDAVCGKTIELSARRLHEYEGNYSAFREQKEAYERALAAKRQREHHEVKRQLAIIQEIKRRNRFDHQARSKAIRLRKMPKVEPDPEIRKLAFGLRLEAAEKSSNEIATLDGVTKRYGPRKVLDDVSLEIEKGHRIGLIGPNGAGKTTLLRILAGRDAPDAGRVRVAPGARVGYFAQEHEGLAGEHTLIDEVRTVRPKISDEEARGLLGKFAFRDDMPFHRVATLSGGERARLALLKFVIGDTNFLVLDEPTNHLDLESQDVVERAIVSYPGTLLVVSHDRHFLDAVVNRIAVLHDGRLGVFPGNFSETRTATRIQDFEEASTTTSYRVAKGFKDYDSGRDFSQGATVVLSGAETRGSRTLRWALTTGRLVRA
ncbi:MAG: ABC-F family ATP-binding cassette domain-containing protein [Methanobacteriota archaeon]